MLNIFLCTTLLPNFCLVNLQHSRYTSMYFQSEWKTVWILIRWLHRWSGSTVFSSDKSGFSRTRVKGGTRYTLTCWAIFHDLCRLLILFKINFFQKFLSGCQVKIRPEFYLAWSGSKLFANVISRLKTMPFGVKIPPPTPVWLWPGATDKREYSAVMPTIEAMEEECVAKVDFS